MRILVDVQGAQSESRYRGIGRYSESLLSRLLPAARDDELILLANANLEAATITGTGCRQVQFYAPGHISHADPANAWRRAAAGLLREDVIRSLAPDVVFLTSLFEGFGDDAVVTIGRLGQPVPTAAMLYDLIPLLHRSHYLDASPPYRSFYLELLQDLKRADALLAISESARGEIEHLGVDALTCNVSTATDPVFAPQEIDAAERTRLFERCGIRDRFVLYTGGADFRKNLPRLIAAYAALPAATRDSCQLVLAGRMPPANAEELAAEARSVGLDADHVLLTGYVSDAELIQLYNLCDAFVFPSLHEGFGIPALEAMACGAPVICSDQSSLPEVVGNTDAIFDASDTTAITDLMHRVLTDDTFRAGLVSAGLERSRRFSWEATASRVLDALRGLAAHPEAKAEEAESPDLLDAIAAIETDVSPAGQDLVDVAAAIDANRHAVAALADRN